METMITEKQYISTRDTIEVHLPDSRVLTGKRGANIGTILKVLPEFNEPPIMGAIINGELRELTFQMELDARVKPVSMADADGARIYRRSLTFLLEAAFEDLFPSSALTVDYSVASGGFFCQLVEGEALTDFDLKKLSAHMLQLIKDDLPFDRMIVPIAEAIAHFERKGQTDKTRLLKYRQKDTLVLYKLGEHFDYHHGYMVPSTGYLKWFELTLMGNGFVIHYPRRHSPTEIQPMPESDKLLATFSQYGSWLKRLGIENVGALNDSISEKRIREVILVSEALHELQISDIASEIVKKSNKARVVLIAGPSASGKTTFSKRLAIQLLAQGLMPFAIEMDNYFVDRDKTPRDENGQFDFEVLEALDTKFFADHISRLIAGEEVQIPHYNFKTGKSEPGEVIRLRKDQIIILEGIHGLNPRLIPDIPAENTFRIYVSCLTQLNLDRYNRISTTDSRLIRRIVRDQEERGYSAQQTLQRWESVRRGEKRHIFPYQEYADQFFNSALAYELSALKTLAEPVLRQVPFGTEEYVESKRLLAFLDWFIPVNPEAIPDNSIVREFIGGSILKGFKLWESQ
ncbi:MAG: nucleoside kinase [Anaerolineaceae bacterium]